MASMPSTVCAGSSRAVSRVPGPPPRTSTLATTALSNTMAVTPEPSFGVTGMANANARDIGDQIARHMYLREDPITSDHVPAKPPLRRLQAAALRRI